MTQVSNAPLTARSVLASTLLGADPPRLPVAYLVHVAGLFGINENRARVALSRMVGSGEVTTDGTGHYELAGHLLHRQARQQASRAGAAAPWAGRWWLAVVTRTGRSADHRAALRSAMADNRMGELREGVWLRPDNLELHLDPDLAGGLRLLTADPGDDPAGLAASLWDLDGWSARARELAGMLDRLPPEGPEDLAPGFELSAAVLRHFQADPLLPPELVPAAWPGDDLRARYDTWDARYREVLDRWSRTGHPVAPDRPPIPEVAPSGG